MGELRHGDDKRHNAGDNGTGAIDHQAPAPARAAFDEPMPDHAPLRQREREEHADRIERNKRVSVAAEDDEEQGGEVVDTMEISPDGAGLRPGCRGR